MFYANKLRVKRDPSAVIERGLLTSHLLIHGGAFGDIIDRNDGMSRSDLVVPITFIAPRTPEERWYLSILVRDLTKINESRAILVWLYVCWAA